MVSIRIPDNDPPLHPRITVIGVGGAGGNAVNNMIRSNLEGVEFLVTDFRHRYAEATRRSRELGMYRQNYCGCVYSEGEAARDREERKARKDYSCRAEVKGHDAEADTSALEREIDQQVYALYGLTPEEIKIVEEAGK